MKTFDVHRLSTKLGYTFNNVQLLEQALTHRSFEGAANYERLEFLGDAVLNFTIAEALFRKFPGATEGELTRLRAALVKGETLGEMGKNMGLGDLLRLGLGELNTGGHQRSSTIEDAFEAVIGAIFLDSDIKTIQKLILKWFAELLATVTPETAIRDAKSRLQELLQAKNMQLPVYELLREEGPDHDKVFHVRCHVTALKLMSEGQGISKKFAEQNAAQKLLELLEIK
jgi:ribonuclease III